MQGIIDRLITVKNFALGQGVTPSYIYKLVKEKRMELVVIDGVRFINTAEFPSLPADIKRRK